MGKDELRHIIEGDPDPTPDLSSKADGHPTRCEFHWADKTSKTFTLFWCCTREPGHPGQHLAGTGERVAAVHPEDAELPGE